MNPPLLNVDRRNSVTWLTLNSPGNMNAMSPGLLEELEFAVDGLHQDDELRCVVITGSGRAFSAGGDLAGFKAAIEGTEGKSLIERLAYAQTVLNKIEALPMPVIAAVNGYAIAGGLELILCCDIVVAAESARIGDGHARFGVIPGGGATARLPRKIPRNLANMMFFTGDLYPARRLEQWGLVNEVVPDDQLQHAAARYADVIASRSPVGLARTKMLANESSGLSVIEGGQAEINAFRSYAQTADFAEGLAAFSEKRKPTFTGR